MTVNRFSEQVRLLMEVLPHVAKHPCFFLKGGTAISFCVRDLPRLSVDIDLAYLPVPVPQPLADPFVTEFAGMTDEPAGPEGLDETRRQLVGRINAAFTDADRDFLLAVKRRDPDRAAFPYPHSRDLPAVRWKLHNLEKMAKEKRAEAVRKLETALHG